MGLDQSKQLRVQVGGLGGQEPDPSRDRAQGEHRDAMLDAGAGRSDELLDAVELLGQWTAAQPCAQLLRSDHDQALQLVDRFRAADQNRLPGNKNHP